MAEVEAEEIAGGWRVPAGAKDGKNVVIDATDIRLKDGQLRAVLTVRLGDAIAFPSVCNLTYHGARARFREALLDQTTIAVEDGVLIALERACRMPAPPPLQRDGKAPAPGGEPPRMVPLPELLSEVKALLTRYIVMTDEAVTAVTLWVAQAHALDAFDTSPYLNITSPQKRCGKSRLLEVLEQLVPRPWLVVRPSEAVLFRMIAREQPTLLLDEVDAIFKDKSSGTEGLRALLNAGNRRGFTIPRCQGDDHQIVNFPVFCAKVLAGIGRGAPDTVRDRAVEVKLVRKKPAEKPLRLRRAILRREAGPTREALTAWASTETIAILEAAAPAIPDELHDRAADGWESLLAIADLAGGDWPARGRDAARALHEADREKDSASVLLLRAIRDVFDAAQVDKILTVDLLHHLIDRDGEPWGAWWGPAVAKEDTRGPGFKLSSYLRDYGITSKEVRTPNGKGKGYDRADFQDAFARYAPPQKTTPDPLPTLNDATTRQAFPDAGLRPKNDATGSRRVASSNATETAAGEGLSRRRVIEEGDGGGREEKCGVEGDGGLAVTAANGCPGRELPGGDPHLLEVATVAGFPSLQLRPGVSVPGGRAAWERFATNGTAEDLAAAREALGG